MRLLRGSLLAVAAVFAAAGAWGGDPDVADLLFKKAKKAFAAKTYDEAEQNYRRALKEMTPFPDARFGLAETLEKLERPRDALEAYRACVREIEAEGDPGKWKPLKGRAQQAVTRLEGRDADLARMNDAFIRKCIEFGKKRATTDPVWARKAFEAVLAIDPGNEVAKAQLKSLDAAGARPPEKPKPAPDRFGETVIVKELWSGAEEWSVGEDAIVGDAADKGRLFWLEGMPLDGRFSVRGKFRVTRTAADRFAYGVFLGSDGREPWWGIFVNRAGSVSLDRCETDTNHTAKELILENFDHSKWHVIQLDVQPGDITVSIDGRRLFEHNDTNRKTFDGKICLFVQRACIEWKELEVKR